MSRVAKKPVIIPAGVEISIGSHSFKAKGPKGTVELSIPSGVSIKKDDNKLVFIPEPNTESADAIAGTVRSIVSNMVIGVAKGFERKLILIGVGFKAQAQGKVLNLSLGFSHPIKFQIPAGITIETPSQTEVLVKGADKHLVGQVAAEIRAFRSPEPYKGKGVRYEGEVIVQKEGKKK